MYLDTKKHPSGYISVPGANTDLAFAIDNGVVECYYYCNGTKHWALTFCVDLNKTDEYSNVYYNKRLKPKVRNDIAARNVTNALCSKAFKLLLSVMYYFDTVPDDVVLTKDGYTLSANSFVVLSNVEYDTVDCVNLIVDTVQRYDDIYKWTTSNCADQILQPPYIEGLIDLQGFSVKVYFKHLHGIDYFLKIWYRDSIAALEYDYTSDGGLYNLQCFSNDFSKEKVSVAVLATQSVLTYIASYRNEITEIVEATPRNHNTTAKTSTKPQDYTRRMSYGPKSILIPSPSSMPVHREIKYQQEVRGYYRKSKNGTRTFVRGFTRYKDLPKRPENNIIV